MKRKVDVLLDQVVNLVNEVIRRMQVKSALHDLDPQVIFFIDHQAELFARVNRHGSCARSFTMLTADKLPFH